MRTEQGGHIHAKAINYTHVGKTIAVCESKEHTLIYLYTDVTFFFGGKVSLFLRIQITNAPFSPEVISSMRFWLKVMATIFSLAVDSINFFCANFRKEGHQRLTSEFLCPTMLQKKVKTSGEFLAEKSVLSCFYEPICDVLEIFGFYVDHSNDRCANSGSLDFLQMSVGVPPFHHTTSINFSLLCAMSTAAGLGHQQWGSG